jgi:hypothetical protein
MDRESDAAPLTCERCGEDLGIRQLRDGEKSPVLHCGPNGERLCEECAACVDGWRMTPRSHDEDETPLAPPTLERAARETRAAWDAMRRGESPNIAVLLSRARELSSGDRKELLRLLAAEIENESGG